MKEKSTLELANRMNEIEIEINNLEIEYNKIVHILHDRMPHLKEDVNIQPKMKVRIKDND